MLLLALQAHAECVTLVDDDLTDGGTSGDVWGGSFTGSGWTSDGGSLVYNLPQAVDRGQFVLTVAGLEESGLTQTDIAEMFTAHDASFSDGLTHSFLQLKMAGDAYDGYAGRIKMQIGGEYGDMELAEWSDERDWSAGDSHTVTVTWGDGYATMAHDGSVVSEVDYSPYNAGFVPFESLRIPNDARYAFDPIMSELRYTHVWLCGEPEVATEAPSITSFDVQPRDVAQYAPFYLSWITGGGVSDLQACGRARTSGAEACTPLSGASGSTAIQSELLAIDTWDIWLEASGPGGEVSSSPIALVVHPQGWTPADTGSQPVDTGDVDVGDSGTSDTGVPPQDTAPREFGVPGSTRPMADGACSCGTARGTGAGMLVGLLALLRRRSA